MRVDEIAPKIYDLLTTMVANQSVLPSIPIVETYDNGTRPAAKLYLSFDPSMRITQVGREIFTERVGTAKATHRQDYEVSLMIREIGGYGQYLQLIQNLQYNQTVRSYLHTNFLSIMRFGAIVPTPRLTDDNRWERESAMEMTIAISHINTDETTYIESVELINNIGE